MSKKILSRKIDIRLPAGKSCFLWGPRKAGKSYWIRHHLKDIKLIDLLQTERTVRSYFDILEDTFLGFRVAPWTRSKSRRMILAEKFYFFDVGVAGYLARRHPVPGSSDFGKAFEHFILMELRAYQAYREPEMPIRYWRTSSGQEVDFLLGEREVAIEIKSGKVHEGDLRGLQALLKDGPVKKAIIVSLEKERRRVAGMIEILPWQEFLALLWSGKILA